MYRRLTATTAVAGALVLSLTGCLGEAEDAARDTGGAVTLAASQVLAKVSDKAEEAETFAMRMTMQGDVTAAGQSQRLDMEMTMQVRLRPQPGVIATVTDRSGSTGDNGPMKMIMVGNDIYMNLGAAGSAIGGGKPWVRMPLDKIPGQSNPLEQLDQQGPAEQTRLLTSAPDVREVGKETIEGVPTTRYAGTFDPLRAVQTLKPEDRQKLKKMYDQLGVSSVYAEIWVGEDGLPRKATAKMTMKTGSMTTTAFYTDYNKPVQVTPPPAGQVGEFGLNTGS